MRQSDRSPLGYYTIGIAALFLAGFFLLVLFGARSYRNTVAGQDENMHTRALLAYLSTAIHAADTENAVSICSSEYGTVLILGDGDSGYAQRVYRFEGNLVEEYARSDAPLTPGSAQILGATEQFSAEWTADDLLRVTTDAGSVCVRLRSGGGAAA